MKWLKENLSLAVWGIATLITLALVKLNVPIGLPFADNIGSKVPSLLGSLMVVALFVERVIEVFVSIWRDEETDNLEQALANYQDTLARRQQEIADLVKEAANSQTTLIRQTEINTQVLPDKRVALDAAERAIDQTKTALVPKAAHTRRVSTWVGAIAKQVIDAWLNFVSYDALVEQHPFHRKNDEENRFLSSLGFGPRVFRRS